ncbi:phytanoyl-CoA dioxygenase family protein [Paenacidovorax monticola]|uniref:Phytanoyl-CoA dioxygenase family protein n=1 Tax=Paenacidovorax monticola TaxID=1926868 RepID=A0A7H0HHF0_9BURK|nr:phytanoyl-CoA dioxygenase family protein [Paenacidovorax monticola]MBO9676624.1 phytanoyl-CoA dioxygenase family protein [Acidovorax sp.]QNP59966.1 phytanoyl-CoA dioxygenase family protein [Paenacidovorax monticola]
MAFTAPLALRDDLRQRLQERVTDALVADFARDGAVCIRQLLTPGEVALLREGIDANLAVPSPRAKVASRPDDPGRFFEDFCNWQDIGQFERFVGETPVAWAAQRLMQSPTVRLYHDHVLVKEPGTRQRTPWHQDQPYYNIEGRQNISMWIPVDPVPRASTLEFVAGSHRGPWLMPRTFMDNQAQWFPEGSLQDLPDIEADRAAHPILGWAIEPGDVVCFHMLTLHGAGGFEGPGRRRVFSVRFMGEDTRHAPRAWKTSPEFPGLADALPAGAPMAHPLFPLLVAQPG